MQSKPVHRHRFPCIYDYWIQNSCTGIIGAPFEERANTQRATLWARGQVENKEMEDLQDIIDALDDLERDDWAEATEERIAVADTEAGAPDVPAAAAAAAGSSRTPTTAVFSAAGGDIGTAGAQATAQRALDAVRASSSAATAGTVAGTAAGTLSPLDAPLRCGRGCRNHDADAMMDSNSGGAERKRKRKRNRPGAVVAGTARQAGASLGEPLHKQQLMRNTIRALGIGCAKQLLRQTITVVRSGGMMTANGKRKRTAGGTFFALAKAEMAPEIWRALMAEEKRRIKGRMREQGIVPAWKKRRDLKRQQQRQEHEQEGGGAMAVDISGSAGAAATAAVLSTSGMPAATGARLPQPGAPQLDRSAFRHRLTVFFAAHNPEKLGNVEAIASKYDGRQGELFAFLHQRYSVAPGEHATSGGGSRVGGSGSGDGGSNGGGAQTSIGTTAQAWCNDEDEL